MSFRIKGLPAETFAHLFALSDEELAKQGAVRRIADDRRPGYPCRVGLTNSKPGDELLLVNYEHLPVDSPYRMRFAIYVRKGDETYDKVDEVPEQLRGANAGRARLRQQRHDGRLSSWSTAANWKAPSPSSSRSPAPTTCTSTTRRLVATPRGWIGCRQSTPTVIPAERSEQRESSRTRLP